MFLQRCILVVLSQNVGAPKNLDKVDGGGGYPFFFFFRPKITYDSACVASADWGRLKLLLGLFFGHIERNFRPFCLTFCDRGCVLHACTKSLVRNIISIQIGHT